MVRKNGCACTAALPLPPEPSRFAGSFSSSARTKDLASELKYPAKRHACLAPTAPSGACLKHTAALRATRAGTPCADRQGYVQRAAEHNARCRAVSRRDAVSDAVGITRP